MEALLLGIYAFFVWLIFIKFKWLPWNITSQVIVAVIPIVALTMLVLTLNVVAPSSSKLRVYRYVVPIVSPPGPRTVILTIVASERGLTMATAVEKFVVSSQIMVVVDPDAGERGTTAA